MTRRRRAVAFRWLVVAAVTGAVAGQPTPPPPDPPPDESLIEFLGADDVGDARWWEFLKNAEPRGDQQPAPPQDANR